MSNNEVIDKIKNLLNKTVDNGCTVEEAASAFAIAQKYLERHRLTMADVSSYETEEPLQDFDVPGDWGVRLSDWKSFLCSVIAEHNCCKTMTRTWRVSGKQVSKSLRIFGRESDVQIANYMFVFISNEIEKLCKIEQKRAGGYGKTWSNSFKLGAVYAIRDKFNAARNEARVGATSSAIVKLDNRKKMVDDAYEAKNIDKAAPKAAPNLLSSAYYSGVAAGNKINTKTAIAGKGVKLLGK